MAKMPRFKSGQRLKAAHLNKLSTAVEKQSTGSGVGEIDLATGVYKVPAVKVRLKKCSEWWFLQLFPGAGGIATAGDFKLDYTAIDKDNNGANGSITVPFGVNFVELSDLLKDEPALVDNTDVLVVKTSGGPLDRVAIAIGNKNAKLQRILTLDWSDNTLDSGQPYIIPWRPV